MGSGNGSGNGNSNGSRSRSRKRPAENRPGSGSRRFGQIVTSLLDTYTQCLALLKDARQRGNSVSEPQIKLGNSLRSDRARIRQAYSSKLSQDGDQLDKGDATARSSLRRVIKRLTTAMADAVRMLSRRQPQPVNYDTLMSLSTVSRLDAVTAVNELSSRIGSKASSRHSMACSTISGRSRGRAGARRHPQRNEGACRDKAKGRRSASRSARRKPSSKSIRSQEGNLQTRHNRVSMATMSSDSTKLGEIRRRVSRLGINSDAPKVTYPLQLHRPKTKEDKKKWWSFSSTR